MFEVVDVSTWQRINEEPMGTKEKRWLLHDGALWLFKECRSDAYGTRGEDWAEKVVEQIAVLLNIPVAEVELAQMAGRRGVITRSFVGSDQRLEHGNERLAQIDADYERSNPRHNPKYTVAACRNALAGVSPPTSHSGMAAFDVWAGYLVLDALVAGRDRHHENWAVVTGPTGHFLAPSFDHGNALGFQESDDRRENLLGDPDQFRKWVRRGRSPHFAGKPELVSLASQALAASSAVARAYWNRQLADLDLDEVEVVLQRIPQSRMSSEARTFCLRIVEINRRRLLDEH